MHQKYAALCGYTEEEIKENFQDYITEISTSSGVTAEAVLADLKSWYNGFRFSKSKIKVYNPWSTLSFFDTGELENYWFETGTPSFLLELIKNKDFNIVQKASFQAYASFFTSFDLEALEVLPLLFQSGYLTIQEYNRELNYYTLGFPNKEVKQSFIHNLLDSFAKVNSDSSLIQLTKSIINHDLPGFFASMDILLAKVDYDLQLKDEKYWQSLFYMILTLLGYQIQAEFKTSKGRIDAVLETKTHIYIFEFKTTKSEEVTLEQIKEREYYKCFADSSKEIVLVGSRFVIEDKKLLTTYLSEVL